MSLNINDYGLAALFDDFDGLKGWGRIVYDNKKLEFRPIPNTTTDNPMNKEILRHITKVVFHKPATIAYFDDGDKVVVKTSPHDDYNPEAGLALCVLKKMLGNNSVKFHKFFKTWEADTYHD